MGGKCIMNEKYYKIDLHIHTPASKCYKYAKDDAEYIRLLKAVSDPLHYCDYRSQFISYMKSYLK